jgi:hypothetical protein
MQAVRKQEAERVKGNITGTLGNVYICTILGCLGRVFIRMILAGSEVTM